MKGFFSDRKYQARMMILITSSIVFITFFGLYAFKISPLLTTDDNQIISSEEYALLSIEGILLDSRFSLRLPEFFFQAEEQNWWKGQEIVADILKNNPTVIVNYTDNNGGEKTSQLTVTYRSYTDALRILGLIYVVAFIYVISALSVFVKHHDPPGLILAFFLLFCGLYFVSAAPVVNRSMTLLLPYFRILIDFLYIAAAGLITLVHYSLIYPRPKQLLSRLPFPVYIIIYGYAVITVALYLLGVIAFGATFPFLLLAILIMIGAFIHSIVAEHDLFLKKQIVVSLCAPIAAAICFVFFSIMPGVIGVESINFTYFALFSLVLPFGLISAMDNYSLYQGRIAVEETANREKEKIKQDLHDNILNKLANIMLLSEVSLSLIGKDNKGAEDKLKLIKENTKEYSQQIRGLLGAMGENCKTWDEFCSHLREYGYSVLDSQNIDFDLECNDLSRNNFLPSTTIKVCLYYIFIEALLNVVKHSDAHGVESVLSIYDKYVVLEIADNGVGFNSEEFKEDHYGLSNMRRRAEEFNGDFSLITKPGHGTKIKVSVPLENHPIG